MERGLNGKQRASPLLESVGALEIASVGSSQKGGLLPRVAALERAVLGRDGGTGASIRVRLAAIEAVLAARGGDSQGPQPDITTADQTHMVGDFRSIPPAAWAARYSSFVCGEELKTCVCGPKFNGCQVPKGHLMQTLNLLAPNMSDDSQETLLPQAKSTCSKTWRNVHVCLAGVLLITWLVLQLVALCASEHLSSHSSFNDDSAVRLLTRCLFRETNTTSSLASKLAVERWEDVLTQCGSL